MTKLKLSLICFLWVPFSLALAQENPFAADMEKLEFMLQELKPRFEALQQKASGIHENEYDPETEKEFIQLEKEIFEVYKQFIKENPGSPFGLKLLESTLTKISITEIESVYKHMTPDLQQSDNGRRLGFKIAESKKVDVGSISPDLTLLNTENTTVNLSDFKGKYILLDFWASWCGPCRKENKNLVRLYEKYKDSRFEIIGVSLDRHGQRENWIKAIELNNLSWTQVSDLKGWESEVAGSYGVFSIPQNFLIDPDGYIIGKNLKSDILDDRLLELLK